MKRRSFVRVLCAVFVGTGVSCAVLADPCMAQGVAPDSSSLTFNDWTVNCAYPAAPATEKAAEAKPADAKPADTKPADTKPAAAAKSAEVKGVPKAEAKAAEAPVKAAALCEMKQQFLDRNSRQLFAQLAIGRASPGDAMKVVFQAPAGIYLPPGFTLTVGASTSAKGVFTRCIGNVCTAEADARPELLEQAKTAEKIAISFADGAGRTVTLPVSPVGFSKALAALERGPN
jgi:invasion protein IalB